MRSHRTLLVLACLLATALCAHAALLVAEDGTWRLLPGTSEASSPDNAAWRLPGFDDSSWTEAPGPFYFDANVDPLTGFTGNTRLDGMTDAFHTVFLRRSFVVDSPEASGVLELRFRSDDGCIVWLNGIEWARYNVPGGSPTHATLALGPVPEPLEVRSLTLTNPASWLVPGTNVLAVQAFNAETGADGDFLVGVSLLDASYPRTVVISEFLTDNTSGIKDEDANRNDWLELYNGGGESVNLDGWFLTDDPALPTRWRIPRLDLPPGAYRLVWASGKDRTDPAGALHANFKLAREGGFLALLDPRTNLVSAFTPYPVQQPNISFGRDRLTPDAVGYYASPTPGTNNSVSGPGISGEVTLSTAGGLFTNATVTLSMSAPAGEIRYSLNGAIPTNTSALYVGPLNLSSASLVKARAFEPGKLPGPVAAAPVLMLSTNSRGFNSNLPVLILSTSGTGIPQDSRVNAALFTLEPRNGRTWMQAPPSFMGMAQVEVRGQSSTSFPKLAYNVEVNDANRLDIEVPLLGLPAESDWVLYNPYTEKCFMNNFLAYEMYEMMGHYASRRRFVEVFVDSNGGRLEYPRDYVGIYILLEKIKIDPHRVDLARLSPAITNEPGITGGYIVKKDKDSPGDRGFSTSGGVGFGGQYLKYHEPKPREITVKQETWIRNYINAFERSMYSTNWLKLTGTNHYRNFIDVDTFVDFHWIVEFPKQIDGYRLSDYISKDRGGKLRFEPIWDWNLAFGNADYLSGWLTNGWYYTQIGDGDHIWLRRLICGTSSSSGTTGDPDFNQRIVDRWSELRTNIFSTNRLVARIEELAAYLNEAQARDFSKYPRLNNYVWPNPGIYIVPTYRQVITNLERWLIGRAGWIDLQFTRSPTISNPGGLVAAGTAVTMSAPGLTVVYTLDGTDPRAAGGSVAAPAVMASAPVTITITTNMSLFARSFNGKTWSAPVRSQYWVSIPALRFTEIMFHPAPPVGGTHDPADYEFVEIMNAGSAVVDLTGIRLTNAIRFDFTGSATTQLAPGARLLVVRDRAAFLSAHPGVGSIAGEFEGSLRNEGERISLVGRFGEPIAEVAYEASWYPITDGSGFSLVPLDDADFMPVPAGAARWRASARQGGSPGATDSTPRALPCVVISEALTHTDPPQVDSVELQNLASQAVDLEGWFITDDPSEPKKFRIPAGTILSPGAFVVFTEMDFLGAQGGGFRISSLGESLYVFSATLEGELTGWRHGFELGAAANGVSFGRSLTSDGREWFRPESAVTLGFTNAGPRVGPLVINEICFSPSDAGTNIDTLNEFVEIRNVTDQVVPLFDPLHPTNTWRIRGGVSFDFPVGISLAPHSQLLVVGFRPSKDPLASAGFQLKHSIASTVPMFGPWEGKLANEGDRIRLQKPDPPQGSASQQPGFVPYVLVDEVNYLPGTPWPEGSDRTGRSLQRRDDTSFGQEPKAWAVAWPTPIQPNERVMADSDGDGLPDVWEVRHGLDPQDPGGDHGARGDPDGDGVVNWHEFLAGTLPRDSASVLALRLVSSDAARRVLQFVAGPGRSYEVVFRDSWEAGAWTVLARVPDQGESCQVDVVDSAAPGRSRYYMVRVVGEF